MKIVSSVGVLAGVDCSWCTMVAMSLLVFFWFELRQMFVSHTSVIKSSHVNVRVKYSKTLQ